MVSFVNVEYLKIAGYLISGFTAARAWFNKEIKVGRLFIAHIKETLEQEKTKIAKVETTVKADVTAVEKKL